MKNENAIGVWIFEHCGDKSVWKIFLFLFFKSVNLEKKKKSLKMKKNCQFFWNRKFEKKKAIAKKYFLFLFFQKKEEILSPIPTLKFMV
jgi:hypothetical protein